MTILGIHHISLICANAQRTKDFYTRILGQRLVKQTVNFDDPSSYHLYFGNRTGQPETLVTFFEWPSAGEALIGVGSTHHFAFLTESRAAQLQWKRWLTDKGIPVSGPFDRVYFTSIYFQDPDGVILEIATRGPGWTVDETPAQLGTQLMPPPPEVLVGNRDEAAIASRSWAEPVQAITPAMALSQLHHITAIASDIERTTEFYTETLGMRLVKRTLNMDNPHSPHYYYGAAGTELPLARASRIEQAAAGGAQTRSDELVGVSPASASRQEHAVAGGAEPAGVKQEYSDVAGRGHPGSIITYFAYQVGPQRTATTMPRGKKGVGITDHFAFAVADEESQMQWRDRLLAKRIQVTPVLDRLYFKSIYFRDPDGHTLEIATNGPGFCIDEPEECLGESLKLPEWLEHMRPQIESGLTPLR